MMNTDPLLYKHPAELLRELIRFDTTNPPGNEAACISYINTMLREAGIETSIIARSDERPNLITRVKGRGDAPPLLLYGHVDVVTTENQAWTHPPFAAEVADGYIWGRGAIDMKGPVAMMIAAVLRAQIEKPSLPGDVILAVLADEENLGNYGAKYLVEQHPHLFDGVRYALGEFGGFTLIVAGRPFYPIMIAEKRECWMRAIIRGPGGHGSMPVRGGAMARLARLLFSLDRRLLPVHITRPASMMVEALAAELSFPTGTLLKQLLNPLLTDRLLKAMGEQGRMFGALLHNTVSPTTVEASTKINVIPSEISIGLDGRLLPGYTPDDMLRELHAITGEDVEYEILSFSSGPTEPDMGLYPILAQVLREKAPEGTPIPYMLPGVTDGRFFSRLGIQTYGFTPMQLPPDFIFTTTVHAADERIPVEAADFGASAIYTVLQRFGAGQRPSSL